MVSDFKLKHSFTFVSDFGFVVEMNVNKPKQYALINIMFSIADRVRDLKTCLF